MLPNTRSTHVVLHHHTRSLEIIERFPPKNRLVPSFSLRKSWSVISWPELPITLPVLVCDLKEFRDFEMNPLAKLPGLGNIKSTSR